MANKDRISTIRAYLKSARQNALNYPNESALVRQNCQREIDFQLSKLAQESPEDYTEIAQEVAAAWASINAWRKDCQKA